MAEIPFRQYRTKLDDERYGFNTANYAKTETDIWIPIKADEDGNQHVSVQNGDTISVQESGNSMEYYGTSYDTKPENVKEYSKFIEMDTKEVYVYYDSEWHEF